MSEMAAHGKVEWHADPELTMAVGKALHMLGRLLESLEVDAARMRANLLESGGFALSEGLMLALARYIGKPAEHRHIMSLAAIARKEGRSFKAAVDDDETIGEHLSREEIARLLDPAAQTGQCAALVDRLLAEGSSP